MKKASIALVMMTTLAISFQAQSISLVHLPPIRRKLPSLPRVRAGKLVSEKARKAINGHLEDQDAAVRFDWNDCTTVSLNGGTAKGTWERKVSITQRGPKFLSLLVDDFAVCGASPTTYRFPLVYRLSDGLPIDWAEFLPSSATISKGPDGGDEGMQRVTWPELDHLAKEQATSECSDLFSPSHEPLRYYLWLTPKGLVASPDLPHVVYACAVPFHISAMDAITIGVSASLFK